MKTNRPKRNWAQYNQKLRQIARIEFFISEEAIKDWHFSGKRKPGGKILYSDHVIEMCLLMRTFYGLAYRQTQGFVGSICERMGLGVLIPDYTTLSRRAGRLKVQISTTNLAVRAREGLVVAIDSTGLSVYARTEWRHIKHKAQKVSGHEKWRKLHVLIDVASGEILESSYTLSTVHDGSELPGLLKAVPGRIEALCGDMAYDKVGCRQALFERGARQLIPPTRVARLSKDNRNQKQYQDILKERDDAIHYIRHNTINKDSTLARKSWKEKVGYHRRSLVETTMWQIKSHCSDRLSNKREDTRITQAQLKCKVVNMIIAA